MSRFVLASQSPARLATLRSAGVEPQVIVSHVDEDAIQAALVADDPQVSAGEVVLALARAKCEAVVSHAQATGLSDEWVKADGPATFVLGCDSMLEFDGAVVGKPHSAQVAKQRWMRMRGKSAVLHTGHWGVRVDSSGAEVRGVGDTSSTVVHFADISEEEIDAYVATGEPLVVAGAFTIDGLGGAYVSGVEGDHHSVVGVSLPMVRTMAISLGLTWHGFWNR